MSFEGIFDQDDLIFSYTTKEAVEDGSLILVDRDFSSQFGLKVPVYISRVCWDRYVEVPEQLAGLQDLDGRLSDILSMLYFNARNNSKLDRFVFSVACQIPETQNYLENEKTGMSGLIRNVSLLSKITATDIDDPAPALFIMLPGED